MNVTATRLRKGRKYDQVLNGAREVFMADGFEGASVDVIARAAGVSKATLYSYFPDKRLLFMEVARTECDRMAQSASDEIDDTRPPRDVLTAVGVKLLRFLLSDFSQRVFRICVAERERFPELGRAFYANGPEMGQARLSEYLSCAVKRGELQIDDVRTAAEQFAELCKVRLFNRAVFGIQDQFSETEIEDVIRHAVEMFMARYGVTAP